MYASGITFTGVTPAGSGGLDIEAALDGLSLIPDGVGFAVVLGQVVDEAGDPAKLLDNREIPMFGNTINFVLNDDRGNQLVVNDGLSFLNFESDVAELFAIYQPSNYGVDYAPLGTANRFMSGYDIYEGVNPNPRPNVVGMFWGYNMAFGMGRVDPTEAAFRYATETYFNIGADPYFEFHTPEMVTEGGTIYRLDSTYVDRITGIGFRELVMNDVSLYDTGHNPSGGQFYTDIQYNPAADAVLVRFLSQNAAGTVELQLNNWTDFADGPGQFSWQQGLLQISSGVEVTISSARVNLTPSTYTAQVNPMVISNNIINSPSADSMLDVLSTLLGMRIPSMTTAQRLAIPAIAGKGGLIVFDSTLTKLSFWDGAAWQIVTSV